MAELEPTMTFIMPMLDKQDFAVEQINTIFKFSEHYKGFCEILVLTDDIESARIKLVRLAMKLNKMSHPHVRTRIIHNVSQACISDLIETTVNHALGQKIVIATNAPETVKSEKICDIMQREILLVEYVFDVKTLHERLA